MQLKNKKPLKILVLGIKWPPETFLKNLIVGLSSKELEITVCSKAKPDSTGIRWISPVFIKWMNVNKWDVVYFPWNSAAIENYSVFDKSVPVVISCRGAQINIAPYNPERIAIQSGLRRTFQKCAAVHCVSAAIRAEAEKFGLDEKKSVVITPAVDIDFFYSLKIKERNVPLKIITTGSLIWRKGFEYALMAMRSLKDRRVNFKFEIIGDGSEKQRALYTIRDLKLAENTVLLGVLSPDKVREKLHAADIFLLSSLSEGISNAALEAMACGLPIVTTDCGGMREAVTDGMEGFVVPVRDPEAMAEKIQLLAKSSELRLKMGIAARTRVEKDFRLDDQVKAFIRLFEEAASK